MIIKGVTLTNTGYVQDGAIVGGSQLLYLDAGNPASLSGSSATTWYDLSGYNMNGTSFTGTTYGGSGTGAYLSFNGSSGSVSLPSNVYSQITYTGKTVMVAANCSAISNQFRCMVGDTGSRNFNFYLQNNASNQMCIHLSPGNSSGFISNPIPYTAGTWGIFAATQDTSNNINCYFNGVLVNGGSGGGSGFIQYQSGQSEYKIGRAHV